MTAHKYLSIVYRWQLTDRHVFVMISLCWLIPPFILLPLLVLDSSGTLFGVQANGVYCMIALHRPETLNVAATIVILTFVSSTIVMLVFGHWHIILKYRQWKRGKRGKEQLKKEKVLIKKSVAIASSFSITWSFYIFQMIYEIATHKQVPAEYDTFWVFLGVNLPVLNLVILYIYDAKFKKNIRELLVGLGTYSDEALEMLSRGTAPRRAVASPPVLFPYVVSPPVSVVEAGLPITVMWEPDRTDMGFSASPRDHDLLLKR